jgi:hypothetical protein
MGSLIDLPYRAWCLDIVSEPSAIWKLTQIAMYEDTPKLGKLNLHPISISKIVGLTQPKISCDLDDISRVVSGTAFVLICA